MRFFWLKAFFITELIFIRGASTDIKWVGILMLRVGEAASSEGIYFLRICERIIVL